MQWTQVEMFCILCYLIQQSLEAYGSGALEIRSTVTEKLKFNFNNLNIHSHLEVVTTILEIPELECCLVVK